MIMLNIEQLSVSGLFALFDIGIFEKRRRNHEKGIIHFGCGSYDGTWRMQ